jgi:hypothetical protein
MFGSISQYQPTSASAAAWRSFILQFVVRARAKCKTLPKSGTGVIQGASLSEWRAKADTRRALQALKLAGMRVSGEEGEAAFLI